MKTLTLITQTLVQCFILHIYFDQKCITLVRGRLAGIEYQLNVVPLAYAAFLSLAERAPSRPDGRNKTTKCMLSNRCQKNLKVDVVQRTLGRRGQ